MKATSQSTSRVEEKPGFQISRRNLFLGAAGLMAASQIERAEAQGPGLSYPNYGSLEARMVRRTTFGLDSVELARCKSMGAANYLEYQLNYTAIDDSVSENIVKSRYSRMYMSATQLSHLDNDWISEEQLVAARLWRAAFSQRQLYERMVEFWADHFNLYAGKCTGWMLVDDHNSVIRKNALGRFQDMLRASAHSPGMLWFLDNASSDGNDPNQNYARELMELYTLGVGGGYTQQDVIEVAKCFSGWSYDWDPKNATYGTFVFDPNMHYDGQKTVLGHTIPGGGGINDGMTVLNILLTHPNTGKHIAWKMIKYLLRYDPPAQLVSDVANVYFKTGGDIKAMIRVILTSANLMAAPAKLKRPLHLYASGLRALKPTVSNLDDLRWGCLDPAGHTPYQWSEPNGYPDTAEFWGGFLLPRWNFGLLLGSNEFGGINLNVAQLLGSANTATLISARINALMFGGEMFANDYAALRAFLNAGPLDANRKAGAFACALNSPSFQWF